MPEPVIPVQTIKYKQYVKEALVEALRSVFATHPDQILRDTTIGIDFPLTEVDYPSIVVRFYERQIKNMGIGHYELGPHASAAGRFIKYRHYTYNGDIEFAIYALSSYDRDLISDSLVQLMAMGDTEDYTSVFLDRIYNSDPSVEPTSLDHFINLNTDQISGFGETQIPAPWSPEDVLVYQTAYRIGIMGEFYSRTPAIVDYGLVDGVDTFPYMGDAGEVAPEPPNPGPDKLYGTADDIPSAEPWTRA